MDLTLGRILPLLAVLTAPCAAADLQAERDLREGITLTSRGQFQDAIPRFLAARGRVADSFALEFNLALCYVAARQFPLAIEILAARPERRSNVKSLLAQAHIGAHQFDTARQVFEEAVAIAPQDERLYLQVAQACLDEGAHDLGLRVLERGLAHLPDSPRLHFERGLFCISQDDNEQASRDFEAAQRLAPGTEIASIAAAERAFTAGQMPEVIRTARAGLTAGFSHYLLLSMLGEALLRAGARPGMPEFDEARSALEKAVASRPGYAGARIALGRLYLAQDKIAEALMHLESGRRLDPRNKALYPALASAYRRSGQADKAKEALAELAELNRQEAERIRAAEGGHAGYLSGKPVQDKRY